MIHSYIKLAKNTKEFEAHDAQTTEGYVKEVTSGRKEVTQTSVSVTTTSTEKVYTATYLFTVDGKEYSGTYDSLDKIELNSKVTVVYMPDNPADNYRQSAAESVKPHADRTSKNMFVFVVVALIMAAICYAGYIRTAALIKFRGL